MSDHTQSDIERLYSYMQDLRKWIGDNNEKLRQRIDQIKDESQREISRLTGQIEDLRTENAQLKEQMALLRSAESERHSQSKPVVTEAPRSNSYQTTRGNQAPKDNQERKEYQPPEGNQAPKESEVPKDTQERKEYQPPRGNQAPRTIYLKGIDYNASDEEVKKRFSEFGEVFSVKRLEYDLGKGFVKFVQPSGREKALDARTVMVRSRLVYILPSLTERDD